MINYSRQKSLSLNAEHPWPGLASYDESSSQFFFGRSEEARELLRMVRLAPLTVLYGKSGLGKTSLLQAAIKLQTALTSADIERTPWDNNESLWQYLHRRDLEIWSKDNFPLTPVLVFDQFEEIFFSRRRKCAIYSIKSQCSC